MASSRLYKEDLSDEEIKTIIDLWALSKTAGYRRYDRLDYVVKWFIDKYPKYKERRGSIYKIIDEITQVLRNNPERPPKYWFYRTVDELSRDPRITDPEAVAGWIWHHHMTPERKREIMEEERKNPIAIYNPVEMRPRIKVTKKTRTGKLRPRSPLKGYKINPKDTCLIYDLCLEIRAQKNYHPDYKGERFKHTFSKETHAQIFGLPDGSLWIKSKKGKPLWRNE